MEKPKISEETQEQYVDATVAAFMEQYANALNAGIDRVIAETANAEFPRELDERCRKIIEQERRKRRRKQILRRGMRVCRSAAVVVLVLLGLGATLFVTVESFRLPVLNKYIEWKNGYVEVSSGRIGEVGCEVDLNDPLRLMLEEEYELVSIDNSWGLLSAVYESPDAAVLFFVEKTGGVLQIDTEGATIEEISIMGYEVMLAIEGDRNTFVWIDEPNGRVYNLITNNMSKDTAIVLCSETIMLFAE